MPIDYIALSIVAFFIQQGYGNEEPVAAYYSGWWTSASSSQARCFSHHSLLMIVSDELTDLSLLVDRWVIASMCTWRRWKWRRPEDLQGIKVLQKRNQSQQRVNIPPRAWVIILPKARVIILPRAWVIILLRAWVINFPRVIIIPRAWMIIFPRARVVFLLRARVIILPRVINFPRARVIILPRTLPRTRVKILLRAQAVPVEVPLLAEFAVVIISPCCGGMYVFDICGSAFEC